MLPFNSEEHNQLQLVHKDKVDDEKEFETIDKLTDHGIDVGDVEKLKDAGIYFCNDLMMQNLTGIEGLSEAKVDKIREAAEKIVETVLSKRKLQCGYLQLEKKRRPEVGSSLLKADPVDDEGEEGLSEAKVDKICEAAEKIVEVEPPADGVKHVPEVLEKVEPPADGVKHVPEEVEPPADGVKHVPELLEADPDDDVHVPEPVYVPYVPEPEGMLYIQDFVFEDDEPPEDLPEEYYYD